MFQCKVAHSDAPEKIGGSSSRNVLAYIRTRCALGISGLLERFELGPECGDVGDRSRVVNEIEVHEFEPELRGFNYVTPTVRWAMGTHVLEAVLDGVRCGPDPGILGCDVQFRPRKSRLLDGGAHIFLRAIP